MILKNWFTVCMFLVFQLGFSQILKKETLVIQGSSHFVFANNKSYFIQESIGQKSVINTFNTDDYILRQGFLQPISASLLNGSEDTNLEGLIFPNPFISEINILFEEPVLDELEVTLYDVLGRLILSKVYQPNQQIIIFMNNITIGHYLLKVKMRSQELNAKLIKY